MTGAPANKLTRLSVEYSLTEHCNISCHACAHASPLLAKKFADLSDFTRDFEALAEVFHSRELRIVGGEPLLHPELLAFLREGRRIGIADTIVVYTNGVLLHRMPDDFWRLIDKLHVSVYPGVRRRLDEEDCARLCRTHDVELRIERFRTFDQTLISKHIDDPRLVKAIYRACHTATECHTVHGGRFYKCPMATLMSSWLALHKVDFESPASDGVALHGNPALQQDLERYLEQRRAAGRLFVLPWLVRPGRASSPARQRRVLGVARGRRPGPDRRRRPPAAAAARPALDLARGEGTAERAMTLSIVIPAHNAADTLAATLDSLLAQTRGDWQAIIVDDGSQRRDAADRRSLRRARPALLAAGERRRARGRVGGAQPRHRGGERPLADVPRCRRHHRRKLRRADGRQARGHSRRQGRVLRLDPHHRFRAAATAVVLDRGRARALRDLGAVLPSRRPWRGAGSRAWWSSRAASTPGSAPPRTWTSSSASPAPAWPSWPCPSRSRSTTCAARLAVDRCPRHAGRRHRRHRTGVRRRPARRASLRAPRRRRRPGGRIEGDGARRECAVVRGGRCRPGRRRRCPADGPARPARRSCRALPADHRRGPGVRRAAPARRAAARRSCLRRARPRPVGRGRARGLSARPGAASAVCPRARDLQSATPDRPVGRGRHVAGPPGHRPPRADRRRCRHRPGAGGVPQRRAGSSVISERLPWVASRPAT